MTNKNGISISTIPTLPQLVPFYLGTPGRQTDHFDFAPK